MNFYKVVTTSAPLLSASPYMWNKLIDHLRTQGKGTRESGAFLLGHITKNGRVMKRFLPYEQLQDDALNDDYVSLSANSFSNLWNLCRSEGLTIVADIHTHRFGPGQSFSDRTNPMVAISGHIAFIVPHFAQGNIRLQDLGMYVYEGNHKWKVFSGSDINQLIRFNNDGGFHVYA